MFYIGSLDDASREALSCKARDVSCQLRLFFVDVLIICLFEHKSVQYQMISAAHKCSFSVLC